jgi:hypothetical protein
LQCYAQNTHPRVPRVTRAHATMSVVKQANLARKRYGPTCTK